MPVSEGQLLAVNMTHIRREFRKQSRSFKKAAKPDKISLIYELTGKAAYSDTLSHLYGFSQILRHFYQG